MRHYDHEIRTDELPCELQILVQYLSGLTANSRATTNFIITINDSNEPDQGQGHGRQRALPKLMKQTKPTSESIGNQSINQLVYAQRTKVDQARRASATEKKML